MYYATIILSRKIAPKIKFKKVKTTLSEIQIEKLLSSKDEFGDRPHPFKKGIRAAKFFAAAIFYKIDKTTKIVEILMCRYQEDGIGKEEIRFPGGSSEKDENPYENLCRELKEESGLIPTHYEPIFHAENKDYRYEEDDFENHHQKFFFAIEKWAGCMKNMSDTEMGEVKGFLWADLKEAKKILHKRHMNAFDAFCDHIGKKYPTREIHEQLPSYGY